MKIANIRTLAVAVIACLPGTSFAQLYYDTNGATSGTSTTSSQNFTGSVWTIDSTGSSATTGYTPNSDVVFSAGANGTGTQQLIVTDTETANSFTFNNGIVTLIGSGSPNVSIGAGGIAVNSTNGTTTLDSSLGTVTLSANQSWNNNSTQALNVNSGVTSSGSTITFDGTGSGKTSLNGPLSGTVNLVQDSTTSRLYLTNNSSNFSGTLTANGGSIVLTNSLPNNNTVNLNNGGTLNLDNTMNFNGWTNNIVLGTGGGQIYAGDQSAGGIDIVYNGIVTGGTGLNVLGGDFIPGSSAASSAGTINVKSGRMLLFQDGILGNNAAVNVSAGAIMDFGQNDTLNNTFTMADGSALETRAGNIVLPNVVLPTTGTVTLGSDDVGNSTMHIASAINLAGALTLDLNGTNGGTAVYLDGTISGSGSLVINSAGNGNSPIVFTGNNNYTGPTTITSATAYDVGNSGFGASVVTLNSGTVNLTGGTLSNNFTIGNGANRSQINLTNGSGAQALTGLIEMTNGNGQLAVANNSASILKVGSIDFQQFSSATVFFDETSSGPITFDGTYTSVPNDVAGTGANLVLGLFTGNAAAVYNIAPTANFQNFQLNNTHGTSAIEMFAGTLNIDNDTFTTFGQYISLVNFTGANHTVNIVNSHTIDANIYTAFSGIFHVNQSTADSSTWAGSIQQGGYSADLAAVAGGRLNVTGNVTGGSPQGLIIEGLGVVVLGSANIYDEKDDTGSVQTTSTIAADLKPGSTTLITNTTTSFNGDSGETFGAFGGNFTNANPDPDHRNQFIIVPNVVRLENGATLGGTGIATQAIAPDGTDALIAPGEPGQASLGIAPSIGTLHLNGGIQSKNGFTMLFRLDGVNSDTIDFGGSYLALNGTINFDFTGTPVISAANGNGVYKILTGLNLDDTNANAGDFTFVFNTPDGYTVAKWDVVSGGDAPNGGDAGQDYIYVQFAATATPEPSTYALVGLGMLVLIMAGRIRRLTA